MRDVVRVHASSGTTGKPIVVAYTKQDVDVWTSVMVRSLAACGCTKATSCKTPTATDSSPVGWARTMAPRHRRGCDSISGGNTDRQIMVMKDFGVTAICCTPTYFLHLIDRAAS